MRGVPNVAQVLFFYSHSACPHFGYLDRSSFENEQSSFILYFTYQTALAKRPLAPHVRFVLFFTHYYSRPFLSEYLLKM